MWRATRTTTKVGFALIALILLTLTLVGASAAAENTSETTPQAEADPWKDPAYRERVKAQHARATYNQSQMRSWHYKIEGAPRLPGLHRALPMTHDLKVEVKRTKVWHGKRMKAKARYTAWYARWERLDHNMWQAIEAAAVEYGVSASWLHACASSEGGHNGWVMNHGGSGAGGWFQFMEPTFYAYVDDARWRHRFPKKYRHWNSRVGQAFTAAYMFKIGQSGQWTGAGCN